MAPKATTAKLSAGIAMITSMGEAPVENTEGAAAIVMPPSAEPVVVTAAPLAVAGPSTLKVVTL